MTNTQTPGTGAPENQPAVVIPRYHLPEDWTGKGACPVCRTPGRLSVQHQDVVPDRMVCGACGTAFEVEAGGSRIRLAAPPAALADSMAGLRDAWLTPAQLLLLVERAVVVPVSSASEPSPGTLAPAAVVQSPAASTPGSLPRAPTAPLSSKSAPPAAAEAGAEDSIASLSAVIGGQSPTQPPPDTILADELERALLSRPENGTDGAALTPPPPVLVGGDTLPEAPEPSAESQPAPMPAASGPAAAPAAPKAAHLVLAEAIAELAAAQAPATVRVEVSARAAPQPTPAAASAPAAAPAPVEPVGPPAAISPTTPVPAAVSGGAATAAQAIPVTPTRRELAERAWKLHELGNSLASIQGTLASSGGTPDDISIIMAKLVALEQARQERFRRALRRVIFAALVIVFVLLVGAVVLISLHLV